MSPKFSLLSWKGRAEWIFSENIRVTALCFCIKIEIWYKRVLITLVLKVVIVGFKNNKRKQSIIHYLVFLDFGSTKLTGLNNYVILSDWALVWTATAMAKCGIIWNY